MFLPPKRPAKSKQEILALLPQGKGFDVPIIVGIRGYYLRSMGDSKTNDRGIYDDAIFLIAPNLFKSFNANTDPSRFQRGIATLKAGSYFYEKGLHGLSKPNPYPALRQKSNVTVIRDGMGEFTDSPSNRFWINIHRGSYTKTSSEGCQTIYASQWDEFITDVYRVMDTFKLRDIEYLLLENDGSLA